MKTLQEQLGAVAFSERHSVLHRFRLFFKEDWLEQAYQRYFAASAPRRMRLALMLAAVLYANFSVLDYLLVPEKMWQLWGIRFTVVFFCLTFIALSFKPHFSRHHQTYAFLSSMVASGGIFAMLMITENHYSHYYYAGINLCITWILFIVGLCFVRALGTVSIVIFIYNCIAFYKGLDMKEIISNNFFLSANAVIGIFAGYVIELQSRWQFYQSLVIKSNSNKLHSAMIDAALDAVITIDETGVVIEFNPSAETMFLVERSQALGRPVGDIIVPAHLRARHNEGFRRYLETGEVRLFGKRVELSAMKSNGEEFPVELTLREVQLVGRRLITAYIRDLTQVRAAEREIERQRHVLQRNEKLSALGTLLAGVAHELNNPLSIVIGQAQLLEDTEQSPSVLKRAQKIFHAAERCAKIVSTFLSMARQAPPQREPVDVNALVREVISLQEEKFMAGAVACEMNLQESLPSLLADADQLHQVISNLLINATQAMNGAPTKRIWVKSRYLAERGVIEVSVRDSGPGIPADIFPRLFEPFFTTKPKGEGTGLGLAVCHGIVQAHGGTLEASNHVDGGALFSLQLPLENQAENQQVQIT